MSVELIVSVRNLWVGAYWERWPSPRRTDLWVCVGFVAVHVWW